MALYFGNKKLYLYFRNARNMLNLIGPSRKTFLRTADGFILSTNSNQILTTTEVTE